VRTITGLLVIAIVAIFSSVSAQVTTTPYAFGSLNVPTTDSDDYKLDYVRIGCEGKSPTGYAGGVDYRITDQKVILAYGSYTKKWDSLSYTFSGGKILTPIGSAYPGAKKLRLTRWPVALDRYPVFSIGLNATATYRGITGVVSDYADGRCAAVSTRGFTLYWESDGFGALYASCFSRFINPFVGYSSTDDGYIDGFIQNRVIVGKLSLYAQTDIGNRYHPIYLVGAAYEYSTWSFVKVYYDTKTDGWQAHLTFSM